MLDASESNVGDYYGTKLTLDERDSDHRVRHFTQGRTNTRFIPMIFRSTRAQFGILIRRVVIEK